MRAKIAVVLMGLVLVAGIHFVIPKEDGGAEGEGAVHAALERLRQTGCFNHPSYPFVVRAKRVRGNTLYFVDILCRDETGRRILWVAKAVQATLHYSEERETIGWPGDDPIPPYRRETLRVRVCQIELTCPEIITMVLDRRQIDIRLPARLPAHGFRPFAEAEMRLSASQRETLDKGYALDPAQQRLVEAFGIDADDLLQTDPILSQDGRMVVTGCRPAKKIRDRYQVAVFAIAQFDRNGGVSNRFEGRDIMVDPRELSELVNLAAGGDDSRSLSWTVENGRSFSAHFRKD